MVDTDIIVTMLDLLRLTRHWRRQGLEHSKTRSDDLVLAPVRFCTSSLASHRLITTCVIGTRRPAASIFQSSPKHTVPYRYAPEERTITAPVQIKLVNFKVFSF